MTHEMMGRLHHKTALGCMIPITLSYLVKIQYFRDMGLATGQEVPYLLQIQGWVLSNPETKNQNKTKSKQLQ